MLSGTTTYIQPFVPSDGACAFHALSIGLFSLINDDQYTLPMAIMEHFRKTFDIVRAKKRIRQRIKRCNEVNAVIPNIKDFLKIDLVNVYSELMRSKDMNEYIKSMNSKIQIYACMYLFSSYMIQYLTDVCEEKGASTKCCNKMIGKVVKYLGLELENYISYRDIHLVQHERNSIFLKPKILMHYVINIQNDEFHFEPLIRDTEKHTRFLHLEKDNDRQFEISLNTLIHEENGIWDYLSRWAEYFRLWYSPSEDPAVSSMLIVREKSATRELIGGIDRKERPQLEGLKELIFSNIRQTHNEIARILALQLADQPDNHPCQISPKTQMP